MNEEEIWRRAEELRKHYGGDAADEAGHRADRHLDAGDLQGFRNWVKVMAAISELEQKPNRGDLID